MQAAGAAVGTGVEAESPPASPARRSAARRHSGIRVAPRLAVGALPRRRADVHRLLEVEAHVLVRLGHVRSFVAFVGLMIDNAAAALEDVPEEVSVMNHAQMRASRDGAWVLQHELERAEMEPDGELALGAAVADVMRVVESRVRSRSAVDVLRGLAGAAGNKLGGDVALSLSDTLIKKMPHLAALDIGSNAFTGSIPGPLSSLTALTQLWLGHNQLSGSIPSSLGQLANLQSLKVDGNKKLSGAIPDALGALTNLRELEMNDTSLAGTIPPTIGNLSQLAQWGAANTGLQCPGSGSSCGGVKQHSATTFCLDICPSFCTACTPANLAAEPLVLQQPASPATPATPPNKASTQILPAPASAAWALLAVVLLVAPV
ncbi:unnamed protein product [Closterium sp. Naga37s-1]|nr:unnamed protein product [Closterium sp. Naga37s-1]